MVVTVDNGGVTATEGSGSKHSCCKEDGGCMNDEKEWVENGV